MSGRAYARNPTGGLGGATDIHSYVPHRFRLAAPKVTNKAKDDAIRRAIQRRCKEKNWKKLLRLQHTRLFPLHTAEEEAVLGENGAAKDDTTERQPVEELPLAKENGVAEATAEKTSDHSSNGTSEVTNGEINAATEAISSEKMDVDMAIATVVDAKQQEKEALEQAKRQLQEMEDKLQTLSSQKHEKFQQLKDLLIAEARSKSAPPMPKKRRVDSIGSAPGVGNNSPRLTATSLSGSEGPSPSPSLLRAQSFSVSSSTSSEFTAQDTPTKDTRRQL